MLLSRLGVRGWESSCPFSIKSAALVSVKCPPWMESACKQPGSSREGFSKLRFPGRAQKLSGVRTPREEKQRLGGSKGDH